MPSSRDHWIIRRARPDDARAIHEVHLRSIRENCSRDHTLAEIAAWSGRPYDEARRKESIARHLVWVVQRISPDLDAPIAGFGVLGIDAPGPEAGPGARPRAHLYALYFGSEIVGMGFGREIVEQMVQAAYAAKAEAITLESSLTAHGFYKHCGFEDSGPMTAVEMNGERIRCYPMVRRLEVMPIDL